jgi:uncharacterized protein involved in type VI secretion and phage assembly
MYDEVLQELAERLRHQFFGKYRGIVVDVDPATMRVKASVPSVLADTTSWCLPCVPYAGPGVGFCFLPPVGAGVWIEFEGGDVSYPIWTGCFWHAGDVPEDIAADVRAIVTSAPHRLVFDDAGGEVRLEDSNGGTLVLGSDGVTASRDASKIAVTSSNVSINDGALEVT